MRIVGKVNIFDIFRKFINVTGKLSFYGICTKIAVFYSSSVWIGDCSWKCGERNFKGSIYLNEIQAILEKSRAQKSCEEKKQGKKRGNGKKIVFGWNKTNLK